MNWEIKYEVQSVKFLKKSDRQIQIKILKYLEKISKNPTSFGKALSSNLKGLWRYRIEDYRIICDLQEKELIVLVLDIDHRSKIYKK
jgi:mRNA interferase RelE/StbE